MKKYGTELIVDLHECDLDNFTQPGLDKFFIELVKISKMTAVGKPMYWKETSNVPRLKGYSGIQFIKTSNILIHTLDITRTAYINFFSCKDFNVGLVLNFIKKHFNPQLISYRIINRV